MRVLSFDVGTRNLAYTLIDYDDTDEKHSWQSMSVEAWENLDVLAEGGSTAANSKKISIERCIRYVFDALTKRESVLWSKPIDCIIIEKQVRKAPRNLMVSVALVSYFLLKAPDVRIEMMSATNKLKINIANTNFAFSETTPSVLHHANDKSLSLAQNKTRRKKKAVELCEKILSDNCPQLQQWHLRFKSKELSAKRDDLADCFLQCIYFLQSKMERKTITKKSRRPSKKAKTTLTK